MRAQPAHEERDQNVPSNILRSLLLALAFAAATAAAAPPARAAGASVPQAQRGRIDAERMGTHDANNIRTRFWNFGMVGDYPTDPGNVDLTIFHSMEVPAGSGMNYSDGVTPFVLAKFLQVGSTDTSYIMETGFRERQALDPLNRVMRFEPRPGYFQPDPNINQGRSPAMSHDPRTWPDSWPDKVDDPDDPGWSKSWNGYFGKRAAADQESFSVMDDDFYSTWRFYPDSADATRRGLGVRVEVRGFQWANPQAGNVIFWHYDITNEGTSDLDDVIFGLYMDSGVGGSGLSCDGIFESDDDNAYFDKSFGLNLVYTYDTYGHGVDLNGNCSKTGYLGYAYLETPGDAVDGIDNDRDGITDERRDGGAVGRIVGQDSIRAYVNANYDTTNFFRTYGPLEKRPGYRQGYWWIGDEDMDWLAETDDVGADGVANTHDTGEGDGIPTEGEPNFDRTDLHESDQIGLTGFKMNRIRAGQGNPGPVDGVLFYNGGGTDWPQVLYRKFTDPFTPARFDSAVAANYNIGFLFASGPFSLKAGAHERFSLALAYGTTLPELRTAVQTVQQIYNANYRFAVPPTLPTLTAEAGDHRVTLSWDDIAERSVDPVTHETDFEGYRIYRSTDPQFLDTKKIFNGQGTQALSYGQPIQQFDLVDGKLGYSRLSVSGVQYWLGEDSGIRHTWTDTTVTNGVQYYYAVVAYDFGFDTGVDSTSYFPSENAVQVSRTLRGGLILPANVVTVRPNPHVNGWTAATASGATHAVGSGVGSVAVQVVNSTLVPDGHVFVVGFDAPADSVRAVTYSLLDSTAHIRWFSSGTDLDGQGIGPTGAGLLPVVTIPKSVQVDTSLWHAGSVTNEKLRVNYQFTPTLSPNLRRPGYPDDVSIVFDNTVVDTGITGISGSDVANPAKFRVIAHTAQGDRVMNFRFRDTDHDSTLSTANDYIEMDTYAGFDTTKAQPTWRFTLDPTTPTPLVKPRLGDVYDLHLKVPVGVGDAFTFTTGAQGVDASRAAGDWREKPYCVPNPYIASASFEPQRFASSGRGDRRMEFRAIPVNSTLRIYSLHGDLVRTLRQDGSMDGFVAWDLRTKDNLDVAPGLYIFHVDAPGLGKYVGKFAVIK